MRVAATNAGQDLASQYAKANEKLAQGHTTGAVGYLKRYGALDAMERKSAPDPTALLTATVNKLLASPFERISDVTRLVPHLELLALVPDLQARLRERMIAVAAKQAARGFPPEAHLLAAIGIDEVPKFQLAPLPEPLAELLRPRSDATRAAAAWLLTDHPGLEASLMSLAANLGRLDDAQAVWLIDALRPDFDAYRSDDVCPAGSLDVADAVELFTRTKDAPVLAQAAFAALNRPETLPLLEARLAAMATRELVRTRFLVDDPFAPATFAIDSAIEQRRGQVMPRLTPVQRELVERATALVPRVAPPDGLTARERCEAYIAAGRAFIGDPATLVSPTATFEAFKAALHVDEELAALMLATVAIDASDGPTRGAMFDALIRPARVSDGVAMHMLRSATALSPGRRPGFDSSLGDVSAEPSEPRAVQHEVGHALEHARPELHAAARALRDKRAVATTALSLNDLKLVHGIAKDVAMQRAMLERLVASPPPVPLDSLARLHAAFAGLGFEHAIDAMARPGAIAANRPYGPDETAYPVLGEPYIGKLYADATEVVSLGFEKLGNARDFMQALLDDAELVYFMVGALLSKAQ